jgi:uncharacterized protein (UPF0548 family)
VGLHLAHFSLTVCARARAAKAYLCGMAHALQLPQETRAAAAATDVKAPYAGFVTTAIVVALSLADVLPFGTLDLALFGAIVALTPITVQLAGAGHTLPGRWLQQALLRAHPIIAMTALVAMLLPAGALAGGLSLGWLAFTVGLALLGAVRFFGRADRLQAAEMLVDAGLVYAAVGGIAFVTARAGVPFLGFYEPFPTLTAMHFLYAGLAVPVFAGLVGRALNGRFPRAFAIAAVLVMFSSSVIGFGILLSQLIETTAVFSLSIGMWLIAALTLAGLVPTVKPLPLRIALALSALAPLASMPLALLYSLGELVDVSWITIPEMIASHGRINALGIGLLGGLSWLALRPAPVVREHPDARVLRERRALPMNYAHADGEAGMTAHTADVEIGHDPSGALFERTGDLLLRCKHYPDNVISTLSDFELADRRPRPGDRIVVRLHLLHLPGVPLFYMRALVEVTTVEDSPRIKRLGYCTTPWHVACGGCNASVIWRDDDVVVFRLRSIERPTLPILRWPPVTRIFRWYLDRALRLAAEKTAEG